MAAPLEHRGISAEVRRFGDLYAGRLLVAGAIVNFHTDDRDQVIARFHAAVDEYLADPDRFATPTEPPPVSSSVGDRPELRYDTWRHTKGRP